MDPLLGEIRLFGGNFAPQGWAFCQGQLLSIAQNSALFSLLGTTYGGDGQTTFGLPDLRGRVAIGFGQGAGLPNYVLGELAGEPNHTLTTTEMPIHTHAAQTQVNATAGGGNAGSPTNAYPAASTTRDNIYSTGTPNTTLNAQAAQVTIGTNGGSQPHNNMPPYLGLNYIIALQGIFPSRN